jgi:hypothetical protein
VEQHGLSCEVCDEKEIADLGVGALLAVEGRSANPLVFHFTEHAPVWGAPGQTAYLILIGLNIEICFMFAIAGIAFGKMLPPDKRARILGVPNRRAIAVGAAAFCVFV